MASSSLTAEAGAVTYTTTPSSLTAEAEAVTHTTPVTSAAASSIDVEHSALNGAHNVITIRYPKDCGSTAFRHDYSVVAQRLATIQNRFRVVHDLRRTERLRQLPWRDLLKDAYNIASRGKVEKVAFLLNLSFTMQATLAIFLRLSPVQPARAFTCDAKAQAWAAG